MIEPLDEFNQDLLPITEACQKYIEYIKSKDFCADNLEHFENDIFEVALKHIYGDKIFDWINERIE